MLKKAVSPLREVILRLKRIFIAATLIYSHVSTAQHVSVVTEHLAPFQIVETEDSITGVSTDIVRAMFEHTPFSYDITANSWSVSYQQALKEPNVCIYSIADIPSRIPLFQWVGQISQLTGSYYSLREKSISLNSFEDLKGYTVAAIEQYATHQYLLSVGFEEGKNLYVVKNYESLLKLLNSKRRGIDLILLTDELLQNRLGAESEIDKYQKHQAFGALEFDFYLACSLTTSPEIVKQLQNALGALKANGRLESIKQQWREHFDQEF